jgi:hypothetical protein
MQMALEKRSPQELSHYLRQVADRIDLDFPVREPDHPPTENILLDSCNKLGY